MQSELVDIFDRIKNLLKTYEGILKSKNDGDGKYDLWSFRDIIFEGRRRKEVSFATLIIQSSHVGFYFMPVYAEADMKKVFGPDLLATLKGKSCFHINKLTVALEKQIEDALKSGFALYESRGWV